MKIKKTYRLDEELINTLHKYAVSQNLTDTEALEYAIRLLDEVPDNEPYTSHTPINNEFLEILKKQLDTKDEQISKLQESLLKAQNQGTTAQALQVAEKQERLLPATIEAENIQEETKQPMTRWQHFKAIFRN